MLPTQNKLEGDGALKRERKGVWLDPKSEMLTAPQVKKLDGDLVVANTMKLEGDLMVAQIKQACRKFNSCPNKRSQHEI